MIHQDTDIKTLAQNARVQGLSTNRALSQTTRALIDKADLAQRLLTHGELESICHASGINPSIPSHLGERADQLVNQARAHLMETQPQLVQPGGALFPNERAEACWRDCWNFLRVITYAVACNHSTFTNPGGMDALRELYRRMNVPTEGMNIALEQLKELALEGVSQTREQQLIRECFQHLGAQLNKSAVKS